MFKPLIGYNGEVYAFKVKKQVFLKEDTLKQQAIKLRWDPTEVPGMGIEPLLKWRFRPHNPFFLSVPSSLR
jgi:hypothetical protein